MRRPLQLILLLAFLAIVEIAQTGKAPTGTICPRPSSQSADHIPFDLSENRDWLILSAV